MNIDHPTLLMGPTHRGTLMVVSDGPLREGLASSPIMHDRTLPRECLAFPSCERSDWGQDPLREITGGEHEEHLHLVHLVLVKKEQHTQSMYSILQPSAVRK